jgi:hypothetical protein
MRSGRHQDSNDSDSLSEANTSKSDTAPPPGTKGVSLIADRGLPLSSRSKDSNEKSSKTAPKEKVLKKVASDEVATASTESLPPNAVDAKGNILVTDYDILVSSHFAPGQDRV